MAALCFAAKLLHHAPVEITSILVLFHFYKFISVD